MTRTSIIIPTYNGRELLADCIRSIRAYTNVPYELIVVDDGSSDQTVHYCRAEHITFISSPANRGFPAACNLGLKLATGDALLLLNNDVIVTHNWLSNMLSALHSSKDVGMVGPLANYVSGRQQRDADYTTIEGFHEGSLAFNRPNPGKWRPIERLVGLCLLFKRELYSGLGGLDERFSPGHYEDDDYCYRARLAGYRLLLCGDVRVHHHGSASFKKRTPEAIAELIAVNHRKFIEKWGVDPHQYI